MTGESPIGGQSRPWKWGVPAIVGLVGRRAVGVVVAIALVVPGLAAVHVADAAAAENDPPPVCPTDAPAPGCVRDFPGIASLAVAPVVTAIDQPYPECLGPIYGDDGVDNTCRQLAFTLTSGLSKCEFPWSTDCIDRVSWGHDDGVQTSFRWADGGSIFGRGVDMRWWPHVEGSSPDCARSLGTCDRFFLLGAAEYHEGWSIVRAVSMTVRRPFDNDLGYIIESYRPEAAVQILSDVEQPLQTTFTAEQPNPDGDPASYTFASTTTGGMEPYSWHWDFGDGTEGSGPAPIHRYTRRGTFTVTLTVTDADLDTAKFALPVEVDIPALAISVVDAPHDLALGDHATYRLAVANQTDAPIDDVAITGPDGVSGTGGVVLVSGPTPALPSTLDAEASVIVEYVLQGDAAGLGRYRWGVTGTSGSGAVGDHVDVEIEVGQPLLVEVIPEFTELELGVTAPDNKYKVEVKVTNTTDEPLTNVHIEGGIDVGPVAPDDPHKNSVVLTEPNPLIGDLAPGATSTPLIYELEAIWPGTSELSVLALGAAGTQNVVGVGKTSVKVLSNVLVEFRVRPKPDQGQLKAGETVRLEGYVKNVSKDKTVGVLAWPETDFNAGNGILHTTTGSSHTPDVPQGWTLGPETDTEVECPPVSCVEVEGVLATLHSVVGGPSIVDYTVNAWVHDADGKTQAKPEQIKIVNEGGYGTPVNVHLDPDDPPIDDPGECGPMQGVFWMTGCGLIIGVENLAIGTWDLVKFLGRTGLDAANYEWRYLVWATEMTRTAWDAVWGDQAAYNRLVAEIVLDMQSLVDAGAITLGQGQQLAPLVGEALGAGMGVWVDAIHEGDLDQLAFQTGKLLGENPDIVAGGLSAVRSAITKSGATRLLKGFANTPAEVNPTVQEAVERLALDQYDSLPQRLDDAIADGTPINKAVKAGDDLLRDATTLPRGWGVDLKDIDLMRLIAFSENAMLLFRSRATEAIELVRLGLAYLKPELMKLKTISGIDLNFLGYGGLRKGTVHFVEPPISVNWDAPLDAVKKEISEKAKAYVDELGLAPDEASDVLARLETRAKEWAEYRKYFFDEAGGPGLWQTQGMPVGFDYQAQGIALKDLPADLRKGIADKRKLKLEPCPNGPPGRQCFEVLMEGPLDRFGQRGPFKSITGDTDFLAILNPDGTPITDVAKRVRIYQRLQALVGMQHGESLTFVVSAEKKAEYLKCCVEGGEAMGAVHPDGGVRAAYFVQNSSILVDTVNVGIRSANAAGDFTELKGANQELKSDGTLARPLELPDLLDTLRSVLSILPSFYSPAAWWLFVEGLTREQNPPVFDRAGGTFQPDGTGGLQQWQPSGSSGGAGFAAMTFAAAWEAVTLESALAQGDPGVLDIAPQTSLFEPAPAGSTELVIGELADLGMDPASPWFQAGDRIVIDPGGPHEEFAQVTALGSLVLTAPLAQDHEIGELVSLVAADALDVEVLDGRVVGAKGSAPKATLVELTGVLGPASSVPACGTETWTVEIGPSSWTVPPSAQQAKGRACRAKVTATPGVLVITVDNVGKWSLKITSASGIPVTNPLVVGITLGDASGSALPAFVPRGATWLYRRRVRRWH